MVQIEIHITRAEKRGNRQKMNEQSKSAKSGQFLWQERKHFSVEIRILLGFVNVSVRLGEALIHWVSIFYSLKICPRRH